MFLCGVSYAADCALLDQKASNAGVYISGCISGQKVLGTGRLQFYSAPSQKCVIDGVFILPGERVESYMTYGDFTSVMYINEKTGGDASGWVLTSRLRGTGTGTRFCDTGHP